MKKLSLFVIICLILSLAAPALADKGTLTVQGAAAITLPAEYATVTIGVETENVNVAEAQRENAVLMDRVLTALREAGCADEDMKTGGFNVFTSYLYSYTEGGAEIRTVVYHVSNSLTITVRQLDSIGVWIDAAGSAGANQMNSLTFHSSKQSEAYDQALAAACANAKAQAQLLADAMGVTIKGIRSISVPQNTVVYARSNSMKAAGVAEEADAGTAILPGELSVSATVEVVFDIE